MAEYIERKALKNKVEAFERINAGREFVITGEAIAKIGRMIDEAPAADVEVVVHCYECVLHGHCRVEDTFEFAEKANPFCCVGKRRTNKWT